jgi:hypothetical protein
MYIINFEYHGLPTKNVIYELKETLMLHACDNDMQ